MASEPPTPIGSKVESLHRHHCVGEGCPRVTETCMHRGRGAGGGLEHIFPVRTRIFPMPLHHLQRFSPRFARTRPAACVVSRSHLHGFLPDAEHNNMRHNGSVFMLRVDRRRSDKAGFFTDLQLSSPTSDISHRRNMGFFTDIEKSLKAPKPTDD